MSDELHAGQALGDYAIVSVAGSGGMGVVYRANQRSLERVVALKVIRQGIADSEDYRDRFLREARLAASVDHPHVVSVYDVGEQESRLFLAMQWVDGQELRSLIDREGPLPPERAVVVAEQLAGALDAVHGAGLIHRDVKPANVLLRNMGDRDHAYLTDFGVAKAPDRAADGLTRAGSVVGTAGYLAPEQIRGEDPDARSDLYALACLTFELMTGKEPFSGENETALGWAHANSPRPQASVARPALGTQYDGFLMQALSVDPKDRFQSGRAFAAALRSAHASHGVPGHVSSSSSPPPPAPAPVHAQTMVEPREPMLTPPMPTTPPPGSVPASAPGVYPAYAYGTPPPTPLAEKRSGSPWAWMALAVVALAGIAVGALAAAGAFSHAGAAQTRGAGGAGSSGGGSSTAVSTATSTVSTSSQSSEQATNRAAIMGVLNSYQADYSNSNLNGLSNLFAESVERHGLGASGCAYVRGKSAVLSEYESQFANNGRVAYELQGLSSSDITFPGSDAAHVNTSYLIPSSGNNGYVSFTLTDQSGGWLIDKIFATCHPSY